MPKQSIIKIVPVMFVLITVINCAGPYKGRLIEADGGAPIPGAVIVGYWTNTIPTVAGGTTRCLDARETVSDDKGEFTIPVSTYGEIFGEMSLEIYKVGYASVSCFWESFDWAGGCLTEKPQREGGRVVIPLQRVEKHRLGYEGRPPSSGCGRKDGKPLIRYSKEEENWRDAMGFKN